MPTTVPGRTKRWHNKQIKIKHFMLRDKVVLFHSLIHLFGHGKLCNKWEGLYIGLHATDPVIVTLQCDDRDTFKANGQRLKLFLVPEPQDFKEIDVLNFLELE
jgi:hypothetical protein